MTSRAAKRVEEREGRPVRVPTPPIVGSPPAASASSSTETATEPADIDTADEERA